MQHVCTVHTKRSRPRYVPGFSSLAFALALSLSLEAVGEAEGGVEVSRKLSVVGCITRRGPAGGWSLRLRTLSACLALAHGTHAARCTQHSPKAKGGLVIPQGPMGQFQAEETATLDQGHPRTATRMPKSTPPQTCCPLSPLPSRGGARDNGHDGERGCSST